MNSTDPIRDILIHFKTIHMVGLSDNPDRPAHEVARYLKDNGYRVIPINPTVDEVLGEKAYPSLTAASEVEPVRVVDVFRRGDSIGELVDEALGLGTVEAIWLQLGVRNMAAEEAVVAAGVTLVADRCMKVEHRARVA
jgi:predicted CoA-binding protein